MAEVKWIKITTDMFDNRKIKHLRRLPDGNNIVLIWVMLLTMAGRCNSNGMIFLTENIPYTPKMLADELDFEENTVQLALNALEQLNMVVSDKGFFTIAGWKEYQNTDRLAEIREYNRLAKQKSRQKQKVLQASSDSVNDSSMTCQRSHDTDKEEEKDKDKDLYQSIYLSEQKKEEKAKTNRIDRVIDESMFDDIREQIEYDTLCSRIDREELDLAVRCIAEMYATTEPLRVNYNTYSPDFVQRRSLSITSNHIEYVFDCFKEQREKVQNVKSYLFTSIFNAPDTIGSYFANKVRADGAIF